jgi:hypothetical protein
VKFLFSNEVGSAPSISTIKRDPRPRFIEKKRSSNALEYFYLSEVVGELKVCGPALPCRVVNRPPAGSCYTASMSFQSWRRRRSRHA